MATQVIVLNGGSSSGKWGIARCLQFTAAVARALGGLQVLWAGVRCDSAIAAGREIARGDRVTGMAQTRRRTETTRPRIVA